MNNAMSPDIIVFNKDTDKYSELIEEIKAVRMPEDAFEISAYLESLGWDDDKASSTFGARDLFELSERLLESIGACHICVSPFVEASCEVGVFGKWKKSLRSFLRGIIFAFPMAISVASMLTVRLSLWAYDGLSVEMATSIAIGTILSFMAVGGFTQVISRRGYAYIDQGYYRVARKTTLYFLFLGAIFCTLLCLVFIGINLYFSQLPFNMLVVSILYYVFLCIIWLSVTVMYLLRKEFAFTALLSFGILLVYVLFYHAGLSIIVSQIIALSVVSIVTWIVLIFYFMSGESRSEKGMDVFMQRKSVMLYTLKPYFIYGFLYFTFLFTDRIIAWSSNSIYMPYIFWFRGQYELGLDFALLILILPMGVCEVLVSDMMEKIDRAMKCGWLEDSKLTQSKSLPYYVKSLAAIFLSAVFSAVSVTAAIFLIRNYAPFGISLDIFFNSTTMFVYFVGALSYCFLSVCLANIVIQFSLSHPDSVVKNLFISLLLNFIVGFVFSRWFDYYWGITGLLAGTVLLSVLTTIDMLKIMNKTDYYIYKSV